ncbi:MAG: PD40 domain-containing protein [Elusimicrobia bacterium]|nr:PD40 domain-containing protein [Elusimicrobiota bacterium]
MTTAKFLSSPLSLFLVLASSGWDCCTVSAQQIPHSAKAKVLSSPQNKKLPPPCVAKTNSLNDPNPVQALPPCPKTKKLRGESDALERLKRGPELAEPTAEEVKILEQSSHYFDQSPKEKLTAVDVSVSRYAFGGNSGGWFGQNQVPYAHHKFKVLQLKDGHFDVYFYPEEEQAAYGAARMAEKHFDRLSRIFDYEWKERRPAIFYAGHFQFQQNTIGGDPGEGTGGFTEPFKERMVLPLTGSNANDDHVIAHEMVHVFQYDIWHRGILGNLTLDQLVIPAPLWFIEGMAEALSVKSIDPTTAMWLRESAQKGEIPSFRRLNRMEGYAIYRYGQAFLRWFADQYGDEMLARIYKITARHGNLSPQETATAQGARSWFEKAFVICLGENKSLDKLWQEWVLDVRKQYLPEISQRQTDWKMGRPLTNALEDGSLSNLTPALSPDGKQLAYISVGRDLTPGIYVASAEDLSQDSNNTVAKIVRLISSDISEKFESLRPAQAALSWSPQGDEIAFVALSRGQFVIYRMNVQKRKVTGAIRGLGLDEIYAPSWSPNRQTFVFSGLKGGISNLYSVGVDGRGLKALTYDRYSDHQPVFSPDGEKIAFSTDRGPETDFKNLTIGPLRIAVLSPSTNEITLLPDQEGNNTNPQWSPNGEEIAYISDRTGISNVFKYNFKTGVTSQITNVLTGVASWGKQAPALSWSSKSGRMAVVIFGRDGKKEIGTLDIFAIDDPDRMAQPIPTAAVIPPMAPGETRVITNPNGSSGVLSMHPDPIPSLTSKVEPDEAVMPEGASVNRYKPKLKMDITYKALGYDSNSRFYQQVMVGLSDMLGYHNLFIVSDGRASDLRNTYLVVNYQNNEHRTAWGATLFQVGRIFANSFDGPIGPEIRDVVYRGVEGFVNYPLSRFKRVQMAAEGVQVSSEYLVQNPNGSLSIRHTKPRYYFLPSGAYVYDNARGNLLGAHAGTRYQLEVGQALGDLEFTRVSADFRRYTPLTQDFVLAFRAVGAAIEGRDPQLMFIGGPHTLPGYDYGTVFGSRVGFVNGELRFPLIPLLIMQVPMRMVTGIRGVASANFGYSGGAIPQRYQQAALEAGDFVHYGQKLGSVSVGMRFPVPGLGVLAGIDWAWTRNFMLKDDKSQRKIQFSLFPIW